MKAKETRKAIIQAAIAWDNAQFEYALCIRSLAGAQERDVKQLARNEALEGLRQAILPYRQNCLFD